MPTKEDILARSSPERDTLQETPDKSSRWTKVSETMFDYNHPRPLPNDTAQKAIDYINVIVKEFPFQIRYHMAVPLWERFSDAWCETGNESESLRAI